MESLLRVTDAAGIQLALGAVFYTFGSISDLDKEHFIRLESQFDLFLQQSFGYHDECNTHYDRGMQQLRSLELSLQTSKTNIMQTNSDRRSLLVTHDEESDEPTEAGHVCRARVLQHGDHLLQRHCQLHRHVSKQ